MDVLQRLFERHFLFPAETIRPVQGQLGGSGRVIVRLSGGGVSAIGIEYPVREENIAFLEFSKHFRRHGLPVPEIYAEDLDQGAYLEEDLGDTTLFDFLAKHRSGEDIAPEAVEAYRKVVGGAAAIPGGGRARSELQGLLSAGKLRSPIDFLGPELFQVLFSAPGGHSVQRTGAGERFRRLTKFLLSARPHDYFLYRDFQSRNVMLRDGEPYFLDYQGGRKGALQYDIASLLYDGKADLPPRLRQELARPLSRPLGGACSLDRAAFMEHYYAFVYIRIMQALGAYGFRGFYERKAHFLQSVPYALKNLRWLAHNAKLPIALPALMAAFQGMLGSEKLQVAGFVSRCADGAHLQLFISSPDAGRRLR